MSWSRVRVARGLLGASVCALVAGVWGGSAAVATVTPRDRVIEQHWELLAETVEGIAAKTSVSIARGALPGGTTKFNPMPTAKLVVVGRHASGTTGTNSVYKVTLKNSVGGSIFGANVSFPATGSASPAWSLLASDFTWPGGDFDLGSLDVDRVNGSGVAGTFDLRKAYIQIKQTGAPTKLISRFPLGSARTLLASAAALAVAFPAGVSSASGVHSLRFETSIACTEICPHRALFWSDLVLRSRMAEDAACSVTPLWAPGASDEMTLRVPAKTVSLLVDIRPWLFSDLAVCLETGSGDLQFLGWGAPTNDCLDTDGPLYNHYCRRHAAVDVLPGEELVLRLFNIEDKFEVTGDYEWIAETT